MEGHNRNRNLKHASYSPIVRSKSKNLWSFSKSPRFMEPKKDNQKFYITPEFTKTTRIGTSMGLG